MNLYHYCSLETFVAIISSKCIRLSDLSKSNDYMERKWILGVLEEALSSYFKECSLEINLKEELWYEEGINNHISYLLDKLKYQIEKMSFISCYSRNSDLLSQWRAYGDDGKGLAIGFNEDILHKVSNRKHSITFEDVLYNKEEQIVYIKYAASFALSFTRSFYENDETKSSDNFEKFLVEEFEIFCEYLCEGLESVSCSLKNPAFTEEDEVRIIHTPFIPVEDDPASIKEAISMTRKFNNFVLNPINFSTRNNQLIGYADLSFEKLIERGIITDIVIGPSSKVSELDIIFLLVKYGYNSNDISISHSNATYRTK